MFIIEAPYPLAKRAITLRSPEFQDSRALSDEVQLDRAMDGTRYTTIRLTDDRRIFHFKFALTRLKSLEFKDFHSLYVHNKWRITDHNGDVILGTCKTNPLNLQMDRHSEYGDSKEEVNVDFEFDGVVQ